MGCTDCRRRPAHRFSTPESISVNNALASGAIDKELPYIGREIASHAVLKTKLPLARRREEGNSDRPAGFLREAGSRPRCARESEGRGGPGKLLAVEWTYNNFPDMKVTWGTYVDYLQHEPGCWRCRPTRTTRTRRARWCRRDAPARAMGTSSPLTKRNPRRWDGAISVSRGGLAGGGRTRCWCPGHRLWMKDASLIDD